MTFSAQKKSYYGKIIEILPEEILLQKHENKPCRMLIFIFFPLSREDAETINIF